MKIIIDKNAGVCAGVSRAIRLADEGLENKDELVALGPLIHNNLEITRLENKGLVTLDQDNMADGRYDPEMLVDKKLLVRTHGIGTRLRNRLEQLDIELVDATCPTVRRVQKLVARHYQDGFQIVIVGKKKHPEVQGLLGHCDENALVVSSKADIRNIDLGRKTFLSAQTTMSPELLYEIRDYLVDRVKELVFVDTTCKMINKRHQHLKEFAFSCDVVVFVGGKQSSNTAFLSEICRSVNSRTFRIEDSTEINMAWFTNAASVGITGGASTPKWQLERIKTFIEKNAGNGVNHRNKEEL